MISATWVMYVISLKFCSGEVTREWTSTVFNVDPAPTSLNGLFAAVTEALKDKGVELPFEVQSIALGGKVILFIRSAQLI